MAAPRSRSRATKAAPAEAKRGRSSSRPARSAAAASTSSLFNPASVIPAKASGKKAANVLVSVPSVFKDIDFRLLLKKIIGVYVPAMLTIFLIQQFNFVTKYVAPYTAPLNGEKGQVFAAMAIGHVFVFLLPVFSGLEICSRLNSGAAHRAEMALSKIAAQIGSVGAALIGAFVMQVPASVTFTWVFTFWAFSALYFVSMLMNCEAMINYTQAVAVFAGGALHYAFIKLKLVK